LKVSEAGLTDIPALLRGVPIRGFSLVAADRTVSVGWDFALPIVEKNLEFGSTLRRGAYSVEVAIVI